MNHVIKAGDVYEDLDPRKPGRKIQILAVTAFGHRFFATCQHVSGTGPKTTIRVDRLRPNGQKKGFRLVSPVQDFVPSPRNDNTDTADVHE